MDYQKNARVFKALCDENRWKILDLLKNGEQCGCVLHGGHPGYSQ